LGKLNTTVQIVGITAIMFAASVPYYTGYYLPTVYAAVFALAVFSGLHYVFYVSKLMNEDRQLSASSETAKENPPKPVNTNLPDPPHQS
jgi:phosphatidylglycerophosphate synthase